MSAFRLLSECPLPTDEGDTMLRIYGDGTCSPWPVCVYGEVHGKSGVTTRLHDACMTSEVLGSVKCDCAKQLKLAQRQIAASGGVLVCSRVLVHTLPEGWKGAWDASEATGEIDPCGHTW